MSQVGSIDSEELEELEREADASLDEQILERLIEEAEEEFPEHRLQEVKDGLQEHGIKGWLLQNVVGRPFNIRLFLVAMGVILPTHLQDPDVPPEALIPILKTALVRLLRQRDRLEQYNTPEDAAELIRNAQKIVVLSGAGISVSCGIPDFRSRGGIYATLAEKYNLDEPEDMFNKATFMDDPKIFFSFAHTIFPSNFQPSPSHLFIKLLEDKGKLLRDYTQNIDTLERAAGITRVLHCHGSFATATCTHPQCGKRVPGSAIKDDIFAQKVPDCPDCMARKAAKYRRKKQKTGSGASSRDDDYDEEDDAPEGLSVLKPDITFFGEKLDDAFERSLNADRTEADLIIVMGTSLQVAPVAELLTFMPHRIPVLLINKTPILHFQTDIMLLGSSDQTVQYLCSKLGWELPRPKPLADVVGESSQADSQPPPPLITAEPAKFEHSSYIWLWPDAEVEKLKAIAAGSPEDEASGDGSDDGGSEGSASDDGNGNAHLLQPVITEIVPESPLANRNEESLEPEN